jgi:hypothetical protein
VIIRVTPSSSSAPASAPASTFEPAATAPGTAPAPAQPAGLQPATTPPAGLQPASAQPTAVQPAAIQPAALRARPAPKPVAAPPSKKLNPGDLICGQCGEGNEPNRKFCSRCGQSLATATVASSSFWQRVLPHRKAKVLAAGERPGKKKGGSAFGAILRFGRYVVVALILIGGIAYGALPQVRDTVNSKVNSVISNFTGKLSPPTPVHATSVKASSAVTGHDGSLAVDAFSNTFWEASLKSDPQPKLTVGFASGTNVTVMLFISGDTANELSEARPKVVHITFSNGASQNLTLVDSANSQQFNITGASGITSMTIQITSVYPSTTGAGVALSDVEFFGKS